MAKPGPKSKLNKNSYKKILKYIEKCQADDKSLPTIAGMALEMFDVSHVTVESWRKKDKKFLKAYNKLKSFQQQRLVERLMKGGNATVGSLFLLKARHGFVDKFEDQKKELTIRIAPALQDNYAGDLTPKKRKELPKRKYAKKYSR